MNYSKWKKFIITEAAKTAQDLKDIRYDTEDSGGPPPTWMFDLADAYGIKQLAKLYQIPIDPQWAKIERAISVGDNRKENKAKLEQLKLDIINAASRKNPPRSIIIILDDPGGSGGFEISFGAAIELPNKTIIKKFDSAKRGKVMTKGTGIKGFPAGSIEVQQSSRDGECRNAVKSKNTYATTKGWGPFLYDIAMEYATITYGGLMSDRKMVSTAAKKVWDYYSKNRKGDVKAKQLDITPDAAQYYGLKQLTKNDTSDDCEQKSSIAWALGPDFGGWEKFTAKGFDAGDVKGNDVGWEDQSISRVYTKPRKIIDFLIKNQLLHAPGTLGIHADLPAPPDLNEKKIRIRVKRKIL